MGVVEGCLEGANDLVTREAHVYRINIPSYVNGGRTHDLRNHLLELCASAKHGGSIRRSASGGGSGR